MVTKTKTKAAQKPSRAKPPEGPAPVVMLAIPEQNLRNVYDWIESENMTMPHSQVMFCLKLLATARIIDDKGTK